MQMRTLTEVRVIKEGTENDEEPSYETRKFYLLHWGMSVKHYTVAICEDCDTGQIRCFLPESLKIIGQEIKK